MIVPDFFIDTDNDDDLSDETELVYYYENLLDKKKIYH